MYSGVVSDDVLELMHINRFKQIFGNDICLVKVRAKFKYGASGCEHCVR